MVSTSLQNESRQSLSGCCSWSWEGGEWVLGACSATVRSFGLAQGSTLISVGLGSLVQTYTHVKKSHACMQTNEQKHKDTYKKRWNEDWGDAGRMNQPAEPREMERGTEGGERWRRPTQRGFSIVLAKCGLQAKYTVEPLGVTVTMWITFSLGFRPLYKLTRLYEADTLKMWDKTSTQHLKIIITHLNLLLISLEQAKKIVLFSCVGLNNRSSVLKQQWDTQLEHIPPKY